MSEKEASTGGNAAQRNSRPSHGIVRPKKPNCANQFGVRPILFIKVTKISGRNIFSTNLTVLTTVSSFCPERFHPITIDLGLLGLVALSEIKH